MTIIQPNRDRQLTSVLRLLLVVIGAVLVILIVFYNRMIAARAAHRATDIAVSQLRLDNAEIKNSYYQILENQNLVKTTEALGYIKEQNPKYLRLSAEIGSQTEISLR